MVIYVLTDIRTVESSIFVGRIFCSYLKNGFWGMTLEFLDPNITFTHTLISLKLHTCLHLKNIHDSVDPASSRKNNAIQTLMSSQYIRIARCVLQYTNSIQFHS